MLKKTIITIALVCMARASLAVTIDLPGYEFAAIAHSATLTPTGDGGYTFNYLSALDDITDGNATTFVYSNGANARIDLDFGTNVYNGAGFDISLFFVGGGQQGHLFGLSLPDNPGTYPDVMHFDSRTHADYVHTGFNLTGTGYSIFRMDIDLDEFWSIGGAPIGVLSLDIAHKSAVQSLVGAYHLQPSAVVQITLPAELFGTGHDLLVLIGRMNRR